MAFSRRDTTTCCAPRQRGDDLRDRLKLVAVDVAGNAVPAEKMILEEIVIEFE
jgi:hypothetical protein